MKLEPRHLVFLATVIDRGGITDAAAHLGVAQPALSRMIAALERRVGSALLANRRKPVVATPLGEQLAEQGRAIRMSLALVSDLIDEVKLGNRGTVRIGAPPFFTERVLPEILVKYRARFPDVNFEVTTSYLDRLLERIDSREIDIAISTTLTLEGSRPSECKIISKIGHAILCRSSHPILKHPNPDPSLLSQQVWIGYGKDSFLFGYTMEALAQFGIPQVRIALKADSGAAVMNVLMRSDCLTVMPVYAAIPELLEKRLAIVPTPRLRSVPAGTTMTKSLERGPAVSRFSDWIHDELKQLVAQGNDHLDRVLRLHGL